MICISVSYLPVNTEPLKLLRRVTSIEDISNTVIQSHRAVTLIDEHSGSATYGAVHARRRSTDMGNSNGWFLVKQVSGYAL
jgi:hypothetical protein